MGTPVKPPGIEYGEDCELCTPSLYPVGKTPRKITIYFNDIEICEEAAPSGEFLNACFVCENTDEAPCHFSYSEGGITAAWSHWADEALWSLEDVADYFESTAAQCEMRVVNDHDECDGEEYINGTAEAAMGDVPATLCYDYGLVPIPYPLHEYLGPAEGSQVHRFCHPNGKTNIKIKIDTNLFAICGP